MARNLMGLYRDLGVAQQLVRDLLGSGVPRDQISVLSRDDTGRYGDARSIGLEPLSGDASVMASGPLRDTLSSGTSGFGGGGRSHDVARALTTAGVPASEASLYQEGIARGGSLVAVQVQGHDPARIAEIMERYDPVDLDTSSKTWREEGWKGGAPEGRSTKGFAGEKGAIGATGQRPTGFAPQGRDRDVGFRDEQERTIPVVEEDIEVGKRDVVRGGVRVRSHPVTEDVERDVRLRDEHVDVERRPVNRPADRDTLDRAFRDEDFEVVEHGEEPMVRKDARVTEEVHVGKHVSEHTEHVREQVRHTQVDVERLSPAELSRFEPRFRQHFGERFQGERYEDFRPAYEFGAMLARDGRGEGRMRDWSEIEPLARSRWEQGRFAQTMPFDRARDCIHYGYDEARTTRV